MKCFFHVQELKNWYLLDGVEVLIFSSLVDIKNIFSEMTHIYKRICSNVELLYTIMSGQAKYQKEKVTIQIHAVNTYCQEVVRVTHLFVCFELLCYRSVTYWVT